MASRRTAAVPLMLAVAAVVALGSAGAAYSQESGMSVTATAEDGSNTVRVTGHTESMQHDITIRVEAPNTRNVVYVAQISPGADGDFSDDIRINGSLWNQDGFYTITVQQGSASIYELELKVRVEGGMAFETDATDSTLEGAMFGLEGANTVPEIGGLELRADAVEGSTQITVIGKTDRMLQPITLEVIAPNGNVVTVDQVSPSREGDFEIDITTGGSLWSQDGFYKMTAQQGDNPNYRASVEVEIVDGRVIPEFGAVAALVLAAAIVAIIAASARSRLGMTLKY